MRERAAIGVMVGVVAAAGLVAGALETPATGVCVPDPTVIGVGHPTPVSVAEPTWLGMSVSSRNVYRLKADGAPGTAVEVWLSDYDSGIGDCWRTYGQEPLVAGVVEEGPAELAWVARGSSLQLIQVLNPDGVTSQVVEVTPEVVAEAPDSLTWVAPAVAHGPGAFQSSFRSDVTIHNPGRWPDGVELTLQLTNGGARYERWVEIGAGETVRLDDLVASLFGTEGSGSLWASPGSFNLMMSSRTYAVSADGTWGQHIGFQHWLGAAAVASYDSDDGRRVLLHLAKSGDFRSNVGFCELMGLDTTVQLQLLDETGAEIAAGSVEVPGGGHIQLNDVFAYLGAPALDVAALVTQVEGFARVFSYASVVDNHSNDPIYVPAQQERSSTSTLVVAAAASGDGAHGTRWRTDLRIYAVDELDRLTLTFLPFAGGEPVVRELALDMPAGGQVAVDDVIATLGTMGAGTLLLDGAGPAGVARMLATSRTYTLSDQGTYGQFIPATRYSSTAARSVVPDVVGSADYRTNIGLFNPVPNRTAEVTLRLVSADNVLLGSTAVELGPRRALQVNDVFLALAAPPAEVAVVEVATQDDDVGVGAYSSVVNNRSGDAVFSEARLVSYYPYTEPEMELSNQAGAVLLNTLPGAVGAAPLPAGSYSAEVRGSGNLGTPDLPAYALCAYRATDGRQVAIAAAAGEGFGGVAGGHAIWCVIPEWGPADDNSGGLVVDLTGGAGDVSLELDARRNVARFDRMSEAVVAFHPEHEGYGLTATGDLGGAGRPVQLLAMADRINSGRLEVDVLGAGDEVQDVRPDGRLVYAVIDTGSRGDNSGVSRLEPVCTSRIIECGQTVVGYFNVDDCDPGLQLVPRNAERLLLDAPAGRRVSVYETLDSGAAQLALQSPAGTVVAHEQGPYGTPSHAVIGSFELPEDGRYVIWAGAEAFRDGVAYQVSVACLGP